MESFTETYPAFFVYATVGGNFAPGMYHGDPLCLDSTSTLRMFTSREEAFAYGEALLDGTDEFACVDGEKYDYARVHTVENDGRLSCNSYYVRNPWN